jgi:DNA-binding MarR family transcriptional regulator
VAGQLKRAEPPAVSGAPGPAASSFVAGYLPYLLARASFQVSRQFHAQLAPLGLDPPIWRVLATLSDGAGMTIGELAAIVLLKQPTLTKVIDRMAAQGLVQRTGIEADRRKVVVSVTPAGRSLVGGLIAKARAHEARILAGYTPAEARLLKKVLATLIDRTGEMPG